MRLSRSRAAMFAAAIATAGTLAAGCSSDDAAKVGDLTASAKAGAESGMSKANDAASSAKSSAESALNGSESSSASGSEGASGSADASGSEGASGSADASGSEGAGGGSGGSTEVQTADGQSVKVSGTIFDAYNAAGGADGKLGAPLGEATTGPDGGSCQEFTGGQICDSNSTDAQIVWGEIRKAWDGDGGPNSSLGYPTGAEQHDGTTFSQTFQHGTIEWSGGEPKITKN